MPLIIEVENNNVEEQRWSKGDRSGVIRKQVAYLHNPTEKYPKKIILQLRNDQAPYEKGKYQIATDSFYVGQYDKLCFTPVLQQVKQ